ncbi:MAG: HD domain-containing protein [Candidatus Hydrogenedentes bacterium]|nr:HD domain-containing protein [Candidatus Hydrogenedentota bacterium]
MLKASEDTLTLLAEAIDSREELAPGSSLRVMDHAVRFGKALKLGAKDLRTLERGALLRDIGKIRIPNSVLLKYTILTHDEWDMIRKHTHLGGAIVKKVPSLKDIEPIVRYHHECWDGTGYPDGLEGKKIPKLAHIVRIVDVFCAMTAVRHYRQNVHSLAQALEHVKSESGKHFAPDLVDVFIKAKVGKVERSK